MTHHRTRTYRSGSIQPVSAGQRSITDPTAEFQIPWLIERPVGYPEILLPISFENAPHMIWYFKNRDDTLSYREGDFTEDEAEIRSLRPQLEESHKRILEPGDHSSGPPR